VIKLPKERNPVLVLVFTLITFGIYGIYWLYQVFKQVLDEDESPILWLLGMLVPILNFVILWKMCQKVEDYSGGEHDGILLFILYLVFAPAAIILIQMDLNKGLKMKG